MSHAGLNQKSHWSVCGVTTCDPVEARIRTRRTRSATPRGMAAPPSEEHVTWKSHIGLAISTDRRTLRATAKGWGRSGALTDALLTRQGTLEGFLTALPQPNASLFIGLTNLSGSLYDHSRAHQEDLDFALRVSSSGELSYTSKSRMMQYAYSPHLESDTVCTVEKGDVVGMRLTPDRRGLQIIREVVEEAPSGGTASAAAAATSSSSSDAAAAATAATAAAPVSEPSPVASPPPASPEVRILVLKTFPEVLSFPFKIMAVFGGANYQVVLPLTSHVFSRPGHPTHRPARLLRWRPLAPTHHTPQLHHACTLSTRGGPGGAGTVAARQERGRGQGGKAQGGALAGRRLAGGAVGVQSSVKVAISVQHGSLRTAVFATPAPNSPPALPREASGLPSSPWLPRPAIQAHRVWRVWPPCRPPRGAARPTSSASATRRPLATAPAWCWARPPRARGRREECRKSRRPLAVTQHGQSAALAGATASYRRLMNCI